MRPLCSLVGIAAALVAITSGLSAGDAKKTLEGDWDIVSMSMGGRPAPAKVLDAVFIRATATTLVPTFKLENKEESSGKLEYKITGPKELVLTQKSKIVKKGTDVVEEKVTTKLGIYELSGDNLKLSWAEPDFAKIEDKTTNKETHPATRPTNFDGGDGIFSAVLKRRTAK